MKFSFYHMAIFTIATALLTAINFPKLALAQKINNDLSGATLNIEQRKEVREIIRKYIQENPEIIINSVQKMREKQKNQAKARGLKNLIIFKKNILNDPNSPIAGNPQGDITIVEFFDYSCGYCKIIFPNLEQLITDDKNVRIVFKELPILSPQSELAARAALAAWRQNKNKYIEIHKEFMGLKGAFTKQRILRILKNKGLDLVQLEKDMNSPKMDETIKANHELAQKLNITGTPAFIVGNNIIPGAIKLKALKQLIKNVRGKTLRRE